MIDSLCAAIKKLRIAAKMDGYCQMDYELLRKCMCNRGGGGSELEGHSCFVA